MYPYDILHYNEGLVNFAGNQFSAANGDKLSCGINCRQSGGCLATVRTDDDVALTLDPPATVPLAATGDMEISSAERMQHVHIRPACHMSAPRAEPNVDLQSYSP